MEKTILNFNGKKFNLYNKELANTEQGETIKKMLVNYKWSLAHLEKLDAKYADNARKMFTEMVKQFGVKVEAEKKK